MLEGFMPSALLDLIILQRFGENEEVKCTVK
jgi:hypothetical protein